MISVFMAPGEADREQSLRAALRGDGRFEPLQISADIPVDLQFIMIWPKISDGDLYEGMHLPEKRKYLNVELKEPQDFVGSVLNGHLAEQTFSMLEHRKDACTVILGGLDEIYAAIKESAKLRKGKYLRGDEARKAIAETHLRCKSFRKRSFLNGIPVFHKGDDNGFFDGDDQFKDILELAHDYLCDGSLFGFVNRPADGMRDLSAASMLFRGIGPVVLAPVLKHYRLMLVPLGEPVPVGSLAGIGPKRAETINRRVYVGAKS